MKIKEHDIVRLNDGRVATVIDVTRQGVSYLVEVPTPNGMSRYDDFFIEHKEIAEVLPDDYPIVNPYE